MWEDAVVREVVTTETRSGLRRGHLDDLDRERIVTGRMVYPA
jgi:hypothetical protein